MSSASDHDGTSPEPSERGQIDQICDRFEAVWKGGDQPRIEELLGELEGPLRPAALQALLLGEFNPASKDADPDHWICALFLDLVTEDEFAQRWRKDARYGESHACFAWFYIGERREIEGRRADAIEAYEKSGRLGELPGALPIHHWSEYRLQMLRSETENNSSE